MTVQRELALAVPPAKAFQAFEALLAEDGMQVVSREEPGRLVLSRGAERVEASFEPAKSGTLLRVKAKGRTLARELGELFTVLEGLGKKGVTVVLEQRIDAPPERVFDAVGSAKGLSTWFASGGTLEPSGSYSLQAGPTLIEGSVREHVPGHAVSLTWQVQPCRARGLPTPTLVSFVVAPDAGGAKITLVHSGFGDGEGWEGACEEHEQTWRWLFANLASVLVGGPDLRKAAAS